MKVKINYDDELTKSSIEIEFNCINTHLGGIKTLDDVDMILHKENFEGHHPVSIVAGIMRQYHEAGFSVSLTCTDNNKPTVTQPINF